MALIQGDKLLILLVLKQSLIAIVIRLKFAIQTVYLANLGGSYLVKSSDLINLPSLMFKDDLSSNKSTQKEPFKALFYFLIPTVVKPEVLSSCP